ncbi:MAG: hypothetical protein C0595_13325 [Marinilabiliales bacterium]|nr:MAG: hypothetical protein C0595_13325 [Marinilabiliales bacterium]
MGRKRQIWTGSWEYKEGLVINLSLFTIGVFLEYFTSGGGVLSLMQYPFNLYFLGALIIALFVLWFAFRNTAFTQWLGSIPGAISAISLFLFMGLIMGFTLQTHETEPTFLHNIGFTHISSSWPYMFSILLLLLSLGITCLKNLIPLNRKRLGFTISHLGLFIVIASANFGGTQLQRLEMRLQEGRIVTYATNKSDNQVYNLPFAIKLKDFILEEYNPKLTIVNNNTGELMHGNGKNIVIIDSSMECSMMDYHIKVEEYIESSAKAGSKYYFNNESGSSPAALLSVILNDTAKVVGWISCGSYNKPYESLKLDSLYSLVMLFPEPKLFVSEIQIFNQSGEITNAKLEVNKPFEYDDFKIYQLNYDSNLGKWSDVSIIELIYDPWLPYVYFGILLMILGAFYMLWRGATKKNV